jgi:hypothetical protein
VVFISFPLSDISFSSISLDNGNKPVLSYGTGFTFATARSAMSRKVLLLIAILTLTVLPARATIPLVLEQTLQLPPCTSWDVQHWMDTNTFGYAYLRADTVYWAARVGDAEQAFEIPDSVYDPNMYENPDHIGVRVMRHSSTNGEPCVLVTSSAARHDPDWTYFVAAFDVMTYQLLRRSELPALHNEYGGADEYVLRDLTLWPPPPLFSTYLLVVWWDNYYYDRTGHTWSGERGQVWNLPLSSSANREYICDGATIKPFANVNLPRFIVYNFLWDNDQSHFYPYDIVHTERHELRTLFGTTTLVDTNLNTVWTQTDGDGTQRLIVDYRDGTRALNPDTYDTLWYVPVHIGGEVARLAGSVDERILHGQSVYDASNGAYLDNIGSMLGSLKNIIRLPDRNSEFVTYEDASRTVRVYTSLPPAPNGITCAFIPETGILRLHWQATPGAVRYWIYVSSTADGQYWPLDHVDASATSYDISPASPQRFFQVRAEYGE